MNSGNTTISVLSTIVNIPLTGMRTSCRTGVEHATGLTGELRESATRPGELWLHLTTGGVTGWESAPLVQLVADMHNNPTTPGWEANFGTERRYDRLVVTRASIVAVFPQPITDDISADLLERVHTTASARATSGDDDAVARFVAGLNRNNTSHTDLEQP